MKHLLRSTLVLLLPALLVGGCKSADKIMFQPTPAALATRLPSLEVAVEHGPLSSTDGSTPEDTHRLFEREVRMNMSEPEDTARFGYARLQVIEASVVRRGRLLQGLQMVTFMVPSLLGVPMEWYETSLKADVEIQNAQGEVLGKYTGEGKSRIRVAMYHGYSQTQAPRLSDMEALRLALAQIKFQLDSDADRLRTQLVQGGPIGKADPLDTGSRQQPAGNLADIGK